MTTKKECAKQLGIYLLIVFAFMMFFVLCIKPMNASNTAFYIIYMIFSFSPAIASLITRAVTKEGFRDMKLHLNLSGNFKWYLLAFGLPLISPTSVIPISAATAQYPLSAHCSENSNNTIMPKIISYFTRRKPL